MVLTRWLIGSFVVLLSLNLLADETLRVIGLFKNAAMVDYAGKKKLYRVGQNLSPEIKLIKADPHSAVFAINGKEQEFFLQQTSGFNANYQDNSAAKPQLNKVAKIRRNHVGMYQTPGFINGVAVRFLVDTGASQVAMNERVAQQVGLLYKMNGHKVGVNTAAGVATAWAIKLDKVRVGGIEISQVDALVIKGVGPGEVLLGMSFLNRVKMQDDGQFLQLTQKY